MGPFLGRRRSVLVDPAFQFRSAIVAVLGMVFLLLLVGGLFYLLRDEDTRALLGLGAAGDIRAAFFVVTAGAVFIGAVFLIQLLETHKTAGVVLRLTRGLRDLQAGSWGTRITLRRHDNFKEMEEAFNDAGRALCDQVDRDLRALQEVEARSRQAAAEYEAGNRAGAEHLLRQISARLQTIREHHRDRLRSATHVHFHAKF